MKFSLNSNKTSNHFQSDGLRATRIDYSIAFKEIITIKVIAVNVL